MKRISEELRLGVSVLVSTGQGVYRYLGTVLLASVFWFFFSLPVVTLPASTAAALYVVSKAYHKETITIFDFLKGFRHFFWRSMALGYLYLVVLGILIFDLLFFFLKGGLFYTLLGGLFVYLVIYVIFVGYYLFGFLVEQDIGIKKAIRRSALVVLDNIFFSLVVTFMFAIVIVASILPPVLFLLSGGTLAFIIQNSTAAILRRYDAFRLRDGEYGGVEGPIKDDWEGLPDPRRNPEFYRMTEEEVRRISEEKRKRRLRSGGAEDE